MMSRVGNPLHVPLTQDLISSRQRCLFSPSARYHYHSHNNSFKFLRSATTVPQLSYSKVVRAKSFKTCSGRNPRGVTPPWYLCTHAQKKSKTNFSVPDRPNGTEGSGGQTTDSENDGHWTRLDEENVKTEPRKVLLSTQKGLKYTEPAWTKVI